MSDVSSIPPASASSAPFSDPPHNVRSTVGSERLLVWALFLLSGSCALIYEVLWCRHLGLILGNTVHSLSAVLTAFMSGLALGSYVAGRLSHKLKRPLLVYGILELLIGVYCAGLPWFLSDQGPLVPLYRSLYGESGSGSLVFARFAISFALLLIPTTFMGATLPVLSQFLVRSKQFFGRTVGTLYAVNTFGAVVGAAATGFVLLPVLGKANSNWVAVTINLGLGTFAIYFGLRAKPLDVSGAPAEPEPETKTLVNNTTSISPVALKLAVLTFGVTGFAAMVTQIAWTRAISLAIGSSTYAFSLIVSVFILGLSFGGMWGARVAARVADPVVTLAKILLLIGLFGIALAALLGYGPVFFLVLIARGQDSSYELLLAQQALGIAALIIIPTFLMGATMPLTMQVASRFSDSPGRTVGTIYAVNTIGAILGSFLGGLVLLPLLQLQRTLNVMALFYVIPGLLLFFVSPSRQNKRALISVGAIVAPLLLVFILAAKWDPRIMSSGMYLARIKDATEAAKKFDLQKVMDAFRDGREIMYYREGASATVAVTRIGAESNPESYISLTVGGKPDASTGRDMTTQIGLALMPCILHSTGPEDVLVIGLGSGITAGAALTPDTVKRVDAIEMTPEVVEASYFFRHKNRLPYVDAPRKWIDSAAEPRINLLINDGRNHMLLTNRKYDVISSEPSNPWMAGVGNLFTREAFELSRRCLRPGGIMCQWVHSYTLEEANFYNIIRTFSEVYPHICLWWINQGDLMLIGSDAPIQIPLSTLRQRLAQKNVNSWLKEVHLDNEYEFMAGFLAHDDILRQRAATYALHTDDNMILEFSAPRALYRHSKAFNSSEFLGGGDSIIKLDNIANSDRAEFFYQLDLSAASLEHMRFMIESIGVPQRHLQLAHLLSPYQFAAGNSQKDQSAADQKVLLGPPRRLIAMGDGQAALRELDKLPSNPEYAGAIFLLRAQALALNYDYPAALAKIQEAVNNGVDPIAGMLIWGTILRDAGRFSEAHNRLAALLNNSSSLRDDTAAAPLWVLLAETHEGLGNFAAAAKAMAEARRMTETPSQAFLLAEASILARNEKLKEALDSYQTGADFESPSASILKVADAFSEPSRAAQAKSLITERLSAESTGENKSASLLVLLAHVLAAQGNLDEAHAMAANARQLEPRNAAAALIEARILTRRGLLRDAAEAYRTRAALEPFNAEASADCVRAFIACGSEGSRLDWLAYARRTSTKMCIVRPAAPLGWELLTRSYQALSKVDATNAKMYSDLSTETAKKLLAIHGGDQTKMPSDLRAALSQ
jgi:spermidine synthase